MRTEFEYLTFIFPQKDIKKKNKQKLQGHIYWMSGLIGLRVLQAASSQNAYQINHKGFLT